MDAIQFQRKFITYPIAELIQKHLQISISKSRIDLILLSTMVGLACLRLAMFHPKGSHSSRGDIAATISMGTIIFTTLFGGENSWVLWLGSSLLTLSVIMNTYYNSKIGGATALLWYVYIVCPIISIGILGAIYSGISRAS